MSIFVPKLYAEQNYALSIRSK